MDQIMTMISQYGYIVLFLAFCLGPFGIPVPNEVTIIAAGIMTSHGVLHPFYTFASILFGMTSAVTLGYWIGRLASKYGFLRKLSHFGGYKKAEQFYIRHSGTALSLGYLIPLVRYFVSILAGVNKVPFKRIIFVSYPSAILWIGTLYGVSFICGNQLVQIFQ
ncbi:DedA family protein [Paenibacillus sp. MCAF9]|uniref:DedA family protein n=1 Tax=unclassified Paenibacillus TaxID=185978 RepID=UPI003F99FD8C